LLYPQSGPLLLFIQPAQLSSFRTMGFGGLSFSRDLSVMISGVTVSDQVAKAMVAISGSESTDSTWIHKLRDQS
jgi:hypothetical protein